MKVLRKDELPKTGKMIMLYGDTGVGKTTSILQSAPNPIFYLATEPRSLQSSIDAANRIDLDLDVVNYDNFSELIEFVNDRRNFVKHTTVVADSFTHLMSVGLTVEIEDESFKSLTEEKKAVKPLASQTKLSEEGWGAMASNMFRLTKALARLSQFDGKIVIITALLSERPKYNRDLAAAPSLPGRQFPTNMPGFFDLIGLVETRQDEKGNILFPPWVKFESPDSNFMAKFTGVKKTTLAWGPLDIERIVRIRNEKEIRTETKVGYFNPNDYPNTERIAEELAKD